MIESIKGKFDPNKQKPDDVGDGENGVWHSGDPATFHLEPPVSEELRDQLTEILQGLNPPKQKGN